MKRTISAVFERPDTARSAVQALMNGGIPRERISMLMSEQTKGQYFPEEETGNRAAEGGALGAGLGVVAGGIIALVSLAIPGGIVVGGPLAALLGGAAAGAAGGGLIGALVGMGIPEEQARQYDERIAAGAVVVAAEATSDAESRAAEAALLGTGGPVPRDTLVVTEVRP